MDGNGRTARLLMNFDLMRNGFPPIVLPVERRLEYYQALDRAHVHGDYAGFLGLIGGLAVLAFAPYWHALGEDEGGGMKDEGGGMKDVGGRMKDE